MNTLTHSHKEPTMIHSRRSNSMMYCAVAFVMAASLAAPSHAALSVTDGGFENPAVASGAFGTSITNWFIVSTPQITNNTTNISGSTSQVLELGRGHIVYQSLGTKAAGDDLLAVTLDGHENDVDLRYFRDAFVDIYAGTFAGADNSDVDVFLTSLQTLTVSAATLGFSSQTDASDGEFVLGANVGSVDISGVSAGTEMWIRIVSASPRGAFSSYIDNVAISVTGSAPVPAPAALPAGLALLGFVAARRRR